MNSVEKRILPLLHAVGVSHQTADLRQRGKFAISHESTISLIEEAAEQGLSIFPLSTCNRTELYAWVQEPEELIALLLKHTKAKRSLWKKVGWVKKGPAAMLHILRVASGLESKILGDFQISGQLKSAFQTARNQGKLNPSLERLIQTAISASKQVKTETDLCKGSASVSFAAIHFIKDWISQNKQHKILLIGTGEVGKAVCGNIPRHLPDAKLTIINRSEEKAIEIAKKYELQVSSWETISDEVQKNDIIITATAAQDRVVRAHMPHTDRPQIFIDLSVPANIEPAIGKLENKVLLNLDQLIEKTQNTIQKRSEEIPQAEKILKNALADYISWLDRRQYAPVLREIKSSLSRLHETEIKHFIKDHPEADISQLTAMSDQLVKKITGRFANFLYKNQEVSQKDLLAVKRILNS